jgi:alpha-glucosidase
MVKYNDFTIDTERYKPSEINTFSNLQDKEGVHWVPIIDVGIAVDSEAG